MRLMKLRHCILTCWPFANSDMAAASNIHSVAAFDIGQMMNAQPVSDSMCVEQILHSYQTFLLLHPMSLEGYPLTWAPRSIVSSIITLQHRCAQSLAGTGSSNDTLQHHCAQSLAGTRVFFLDVRDLPIVSLVVPVKCATWQCCIDECCQGLLPDSDQALLVALISKSSSTLDGKLLSPDYPVQALWDATIRLRLPGLIGGGRGQTSVFASLSRGAQASRGLQLTAE
jgi:hypothetical protein